jgi:hypothetical protein
LNKRERDTFKLKGDDDNEVAEIDTDIIDIKMEEEEERKRKEKEEEERLIEERKKAEAITLAKCIIYYNINNYILIMKNIYLYIYLFIYNIAGRDLSKCTRILKIYIFTGTIFDNVEGINDYSNTYISCKFHDEEQKIIPKQGKYPIFGEGI